MAQVVVSLGGEEIVTEESGWQEAAGRLHKKYGGVPQVKRLGPPASGEERPRDNNVVSFPTQPRLIAQRPTVPALVRSFPQGNDVGVDAEGAARSQKDLETAILAGFAPAQPLYTRGTRVVAAGVANGHRSREQYEALPLLRDACGDLIDRIAKEKRQNLPVPVRGVEMADTGELLLCGERYHLTPAALTQLCTRIGFGGGDYLARCPTDLRATNVNEWIGRKVHGQLPPHVAARVVSPDKNVVFRTRENLALGKREIFAVVSVGYTSFDVDRMAEVIGQQLPSDARGEVTYDGLQARWNVLYQTTVQPENFVAGEFFRAGLSLRTADDGTGSLRGSAILFQNLCLNLLIIDRAEKETLRAAHKGSLEKLIAAIHNGVQEGLDAIAPFLKAWGYATTRDVRQDLAYDEELVGLPVSQVIPGIFNGIVERDLVRIGGQREEVVQRLVNAWEKDTSAARGPTLGAVVNAFTRYAHEETEDPWEQDAIQRQASELLRGPVRKGLEGKPAPLPYVPLVLPGRSPPPR